MHVDYQETLALLIIILRAEQGSLGHPQQHPSPELSDNTLPRIMPHTPKDIAATPPTPPTPAAAAQQAAATTTTAGGVGVGVGVVAAVLTCCIMMRLCLKGDRVGRYLNPEACNGIAS